MLKCMQVKVRINVDDDFAAESMLWVQHVLVCILHKRAKATHFGKGHLIQCISLCRAHHYNKDIFLT